MPMFRTIKVHLRDLKDHPEMTVTVMHITGVRRDMIGNVERATITTTMSGQVIQTTETYAEVLKKLEIIQ